MARQCMITGVKTTVGNNVAHCNTKVKRTFKVNVRWKRFWFDSENRFVRLFVSSRGMRTIDKRGIDVVVAELRAQGEKV